MIHRERSGAVGVLTIDRPERRNAVDSASCAALEEGLRGFVGDECRVVVLTGAGGHFCAGADLGGVEDGGFRAALRSLLDALVSVPVPVMAAVSGAALGAGTQLAAACDLRVASADARFGIPAAKLGLMTDHWTVKRVAHLAGLSTAQAMLLASEEVDGAAAVRLGLAHRAGGLEEALAWAAEVAALAPLTLAGFKLALGRLSEPADDPLVAEAVTRAWASEDLAEGKAAFRERRAPVFRGR